MKITKKLLSILLSIILALGVCSAGIIAYAGPAVGQEYPLKGLNPDDAAVKPTLTISSETLDYDVAKNNRVRDVTLTVQGAANRYAPTGLHIKVDSRLRVVTGTYGEYASLGAAGRYLSQYQQGYDNGIFVATAASDDRGQDGVLWSFQVELPEDIDPAGDNFPIQIEYRSSPSATDEFTNGDRDEQGQLMQAYLFTKGIMHGGIKVKAVPASYNISATANPAEGGSVSGSGSYTEGSPVTLAATPYEHYHFVDWTENGVRVSTDPQYTFKVTGDRSLVANFEKDTYTIKFVNEDGTVLQSGPVAYGEKPSYTGETPAKGQSAESTFMFAGWSPEIRSVTGEATYTATYIRMPREYEITFVNDDGSVLQSSPVAYGETPEYKGETPVKAATAEFKYDFLEWTPGIVPVAGDKTYTATYISTPVDYKLTWMVDGESYKNETIPFGNEVKAPEVETKEGYTFAWADDIPATMPAKDVTINGEYTPIEYTATFVDENGAKIAEVPFTVKSESIAEPAVPEKAGYEGKWSEYTIAAADIEIQPVYTVIEYTATFVDENGAKIAEVPFTVESESIEEPAVPEKGGYEAAWEEYEIGAGDLTIKPVYTPTDICPLDDEYHGTSFWGKLTKFLHTVIFRAFALVGLNVYFRIS